MANIYKSKYTGAQVDEALGKVDTKLDKTGGTISGDVTITGDLTINGTEHINNVENLNVKNAMIYSNADGATLSQNGGIGIKKNSTDTYGIVYDPNSDAVKLGLGKADTNGNFTFNTDEGQPVAIRDDSSKLTNGHLVQWDGTNHKLVDGGSLSRIEAKLNENIIKDPSKTYLVWKGSEFPNSSRAKFKAPANSSIDWGDGTVETFTTASTTVNTHTYTDGFEYHLISISGLTFIGNNWFFYCKGLTSMTIGNGVTYIYDEAFSENGSLESVTIPDSVTNFGFGAFWSGVVVKKMIVKSTSVPTIEEFAIEGAEKIIVPKSAINAYKSARGWSEYADRIVYEVDSSDIPDLSKYALTSDVAAKSSFSVEVW